MNNLLYFSNKETINKLMSDELLSEVKNELKIYKMYICDCEIDISMSAY